MKKLLTLLFLLLPVTSFSAGSGVHLDDANVDLSDRTSLQRGAKVFVNYCLSCHSAAYMRFSRTAEDLDIPVDVMKKNMLFMTDKMGSMMEVSMHSEDAKKWLGVAPPDLSVIARSRGSDWLYTFLRSFYLDPTRATGTNNSVFKDTAMPHVLWELQGWQKPVYETQTDAEGKEVKVLHDLELVSPGSLNEEAYDQTIRDLVNYLTYMGEPAKLVRYKIGMWVIIFLLIFLIPAYKLKKEYWKDVR